MHSQDSLDPSDWPAFRAQAHSMLDDMLNHLQQLGEHPVWQPIPAELRERFQTSLPQLGTPLSDLHKRFLDEILPYSVCNGHPGFMGWVQGGGTPVGMLAEMLAAGLNANLGGRDQIPLEVEKQILHWMRELFRFPTTANGLFVTGTSLANLIAVLIARTTKLGTTVRQHGITNNKLTAYTSAGAHGCVNQAMDLAGFGTAALRKIPVNAQYQIDVNKLAEAIQTDKAAGFTPFLIIGTAGSVDVGAIDDLNALANIAEEEQCWFHIDGAFGALGMFSKELAPRLAGIERASSIAFDFHKWGQVPYDAGYILVRDGQLQLDTFSAPANYLMREKKERGMAAGSPWPCDLGPDLSRGFRALKTWFTIATFGAEKLGKIIDNTCTIAQYLKQRIEQESQLELLAPVNLNIACFRYVDQKMTPQQINTVNAKIVVRLHESGVVAPSSTMLNEQFAIRAAIVNHRVTESEIDKLIHATLTLGDELCNSINDWSQHDCYTR